MDSITDWHHAWVVHGRVLALACFLAAVALWAAWSRHTWYRHALHSSRLASRLLEALDGANRASGVFAKAAGEYEAATREADTLEDAREHIAKVKAETVERLTEMGEMSRPTDKSASLAERVLVLEALQASAKRGKSLRMLQRGVEDVQDGIAKLAEGKQQQPDEIYRCLTALRNNERDHAQAAQLIGLYRRSGEEAGIWLGKCTAQEADSEQQLAGLARFYDEAAAAVRRTAYGGEGGEDAAETAPGELER